MKRGWSWPLVAIALVLLLGSAWYFLLKQSQTEVAQSPGPREGGPARAGAGGAEADASGVQRLPVKVAPARQGDLAVTLPVFGSVTYVDKCDASYEESTGIIQEVLVDVGDLVRPGQVVAVIDTAVLRAELKSLQARLEQAHAHYELAAWKYQALRQVQAKGGSSLHDLEEAATAYQARQAEVAQIEADIGRIRAKLQKAVIRSPIVGIVGKKNYFPGERVPIPSEKGVVTILRVDEVYVEAEISDKDLAKLRPGLEANIFPDAYPRTVFKGRVEQLEPVLREQSRTVIARVRVKNPDFLLRPGMFSRLDIVLEKTPQVVAIPIQALRLSPDKATEVFVIVDNVAFKKKVEVGLTTATEAEIKSGLQPGDLVVVEGGEQLKELARVIPIPYQASPPSP